MPIFGQNRSYNDNFLKSYSHLNLKHNKYYFSKTLIYTIRE
jgi:hypothetical protein